MNRKPITEADALNRLAAYCSVSEHCRADVREKLQKWGLSAEAMEHIISRLEEVNFLDESRYAKAFVNDKLRFSGWGKRKIALALQQKHVARTTFQPFLDAIDAEEYLQILRKALEQKARTLKAEDSDYQRRLKLTRFAMSRGFSYEDIRQCMDLSDIDEAECQ